MRIVLQRVKEARVTVDEKTIGQIGRGLVILLGVKAGDTEDDARFLADKVVNLRIFGDAQGKMNLSAMEVSGEILAISQFTLYGDCRKGRRPSFTRAASPDGAERLYERFIDYLQLSGLKVESGEFGAKMLVNIANDGPVTLILESPQD